jgi:anhydro-N-acetylmuramic acid kinase
MRFVGLMSGTSVDGIDAALVDIAGGDSGSYSGLSPLRIQLLGGRTYPYPPALRQQILEVCAGAALSMQALATLDDAIAHCFAAAAIAIVQAVGDSTLPVAIGSHGQTVFHAPPGQLNRDQGDGARGGMSLGYSLQLGRGATIAQRTGITTVSNFRAGDIALGGQGAPLVPAVDAALLRDGHLIRCVQNIGGIGNVTYLPPKQSEQPVLGWDTGPGNVLIDLAVTQLSQGKLTYDRDGAWAAAGSSDRALVEQWLDHEFFRQPPPKSTGRELFGPEFLQRCLGQMPHHSPADQLATLTDFTAASIVCNYQSFLPQLPDQVYLCGGGSHNPTLRSLLRQRLPQAEVFSTSEVGLDADFKEAMAFALLAYWRIQGQPGNLPAVTGAQGETLLGEIHSPGPLMLA